MADAPGGGKRARPGGHRLRQEVLEHHQRQRILSGAAKVIAARGYRQVTVADIVRSAAIARARFYENFSSKQDCFFVLYDGACVDALQAVSTACEGGGSSEFSARVRIGIEALLAFLESDLDLARACVVEGPAVPEINSRFEKMLAGFAELLRHGRGDGDSANLPDTAEETVVGGFYWLLYYALLDRGSESLADLASQLSEFALIPFVGIDGAHNTTI